MAAVAERAHADILSDTPLASDPVSVTMPPVIVQGQVARQRALLPPGQDLVQIIGWRQRPMQVPCSSQGQALGIRRVAAETRVVGGDEPRQPGVRRRVTVPPLYLLTPW